MAVYDCDAYTVERHPPEAVIFPRSTESVVEAVRICRRHGVAMVPRGGGTSKAGGCVAVGRSVVFMLTRMNRILEIDAVNKMTFVEAGVPNIYLTQALKGTGLHFAPDPSSQISSTLGGNVATNAGGPHTLKYGVTVGHVLGVEVVVGDGEVIQLGPLDDPGSLDLISLLVGNEGTLGIITKAWLRLTPDQQACRTFRALFNTIEDASQTVSQIIAAGILPSAMELMDQGITAAVEKTYHFGFPADAGAILILEIDGSPGGLDRQQTAIVDMCNQNNAREVLQAASEEERTLLWKCRKSAGGAVGRLSPTTISQDVIVPRTKLPEMLRRVAEIGRVHRTPIVSLAHAGDGNVHPIVLFDERYPEEYRRALAAIDDIIAACLDLGGSVSAEHGIGIEKIAFMPKQFTKEDLTALYRVREAFDPRGQFNPGKKVLKP